jgi:hypothetical protein
MAEMTDELLDAITIEEARDALMDPVRGSLRVLKALGRARDAFSAQLVEGVTRLEVKNDLERVAAEAAVEAYSAELVEEGEPVPKITVTQPRPLFK